MADYDFRTLSPLDFELLVRDLFNAEYGSMLTTFAPGADGGVDIRGNCPKWGEVVVQCKHTPDATRSDIVRAAKKEAAKWAGPDLPDAYFFATSANMSPDTEDLLPDALSPLSVPVDGVWHRGRLNALLAKHVHVERKHFKLWLASTVVLERILDSGEWQRSEALLQLVQDRVRLFVMTPAYGTAFAVLEKENAVVITGPPGCGKSTLAEMLLLTAWNEQWTIVDITLNIAEGWRYLRGGLEKVVFYYDDFLGQIDTAEVAKNEATGIAQFLERIRRGDGTRRLVMTTRDQVLAQARSGPDDRLRRLPVEESQAPVLLEELDRVTKAHILFNHMHFAIQNPATRSDAAVDSRYLAVIDHRNFSPRIVESATLRQKFESLDGMYEGLLSALDNPDELWLGSFYQLSEVAASVLLGLVTSLRGAMDLHLLRSAVHVTDPRSWDQALKVLEGTWIRLNATSDQGVDEASLFDPSRRDFLLGLLPKDDYLARAIDLTVNTEQLTYLVRLAGARFRAGEVVIEPDTDPKLWNTLQRHLPLMVSAAQRCAQNELEELAEREPLGMYGSTTRWPARTNWFWDAAKVQASILKRAAEVLALSPVDNVTDWFLVELQRYIESGQQQPTVEAQSTFGLAEAVYDLGARARLNLSTDIEELVVLGAEAIDESDDIDYYGHLSDDLKSQRVEEAAHDAIQQTLEFEKDSIMQETDPDAVSSWLEDTRDRLTRFDHYLDLDEVEDRSSVLHSRPRSARPRIEPIEAGGPTDREKTAESDESNEAIGEIFARLSLGGSAKEIEE